MSESFFPYQIKAQNWTSQRARSYTTKWILTFSHSLYLYNMLITLSLILYDIFLLRFLLRASFQWKNRFFLFVIYFTCFFKSRFFVRNYLQQKSILKYTRHNIIEKTAEKTFSLFSLCSNYLTLKWTESFESLITEGFNEWLHSK